MTPVAPAREGDGAPVSSSARELRSPTSVLARALAAGAAGGGVLGALAVVPDALEAQLAPEPDTAYAVTWGSLVVAVPVGALVGLVSALLAVIVWEWQLRRGAARARVAAGVTAAVAVLGVAAALHALLSPLAVPGAAAAFAVAYAATPVLTTRPVRPDR